MLEGFDESWLALLRLSEDIKIYRHAIREPVTSYVNGKALMIGDAAHPMTPGELNPMCLYDSNVDVYFGRSSCRRRRHLARRRSCIGNPSCRHSRAAGR